MPFRWRLKMKVTANAEQIIDTVPEILWFTHQKEAEKVCGPVSFTTFGAFSEVERDWASKEDAQYVLDLIEAQVFFVEGDIIDLESIQ